MKILIIDTDCVGLSFCWRCVIAGHEVKWFIKPKPENHPDTGKGFLGIDKVTNWVGYAKWADLVFATSNDDYIERLEVFSKRGIPVFAPSVASANLEISRKAGMELLEKVGIEVAPYKTFKTMKEAEAHVKKTEERYVFKTLGDNEDKSLTYVSKSPADMINWMQRTRNLKQEPKGDVMLQTFVQGTEFGVSRWMGSEGWVGQFNESFEQKKLMPSNFGPNTGEMGTIAAFVPESKLGGETLAKCEEELQKLGHRGDVALGFMVDESGKPLPTEWTCRPGWPIFNMMLGSIDGDPAEWMLDALKGKDTTKFKEDIGACFVVAHKDFPHGGSTREETEGVPIYGVTRGNKRHLHPQGVKIDPMLDMAGEKMIEHPVWNTTNNYSMVVTGYSEKTVKQAMDRAFKTVKQLHISNMIVRDDIGECLEKDLPKLHKHGYATHFVYDQGDKK